ncbi:MAG: GNAT family N-acetyltransferase [Alphaproteobacteria bacterium]|nr:GNAT family N-acetyltransferase [Alphaproteobacteria bacterium]MDE2266342.1 GNAT family N-acetyltransferase [Alphaproteobacteria bacterium]MDE2499627.1 GNAT family N-acetyltransferase [Alphaproteobacteria bacterium]
MPRLETERLLLRPPEFRDVPAITTWIGDWDVAKNLASVPHPYREDDAHEFVALATEKFAKGEGYCFSVTRKQDGVFMGNCGLNLKDGKFELGYWLGKPFWRQGYATEAAKKVISFAFHDLKAVSIWAGWFHDNPASGRVLQKLGCRHDGAAPRNSMARGHEVYCHLMALTREEFGRKKAA